VDESLLELLQGVLDRKLNLHLDIHDETLHSLHRQAGRNRLINRFLAAGGFPPAPSL